MKEETPNEYFGFFENYARAIMEFRDYEDMCKSAYQYLNQAGILAFDMDGSLCAGRVNGVEFIDHLLDYFKDSEDSKRSKCLRLIRDELIEVRNTHTV